jgi:hypothetical protein
MIVVRQRITDKNGWDLSIGDKICLRYPNGKFMGYAVLVWDEEEYKITTSPVLVCDNYELVHTYLPLCTVVRTRG